MTPTSSHFAPQKVRPKTTKVREFAQKRKPFGVRFSGLGIRASWRRGAIARLQTERFGEMLANPPLKDARWVSIGGDSPVSSMLGMIGAAKEAIEKVSGSLREQA